MDLPTWIMVGAIVLFAAMALWMRRGNGKFMLNGLGFHSVEERDRFDPERMLRFVGTCMLGIDLALALALVSFKFKLEWLAIVAAGVIIVICLGATIYMKTGERFARTEDKSNKAE